ncbi:MAG: hypothetical protein H7Y14_10875 [Burkholderiales bacterium]|nr:hypothetical protein [Burkholderiales bacterium]
MTHNASRITAAGIAIAAVTLISVASGGSQPRSPSGDPSVPPAWEVLHANDARSSGNVNDMTY